MVLQICGFLWDINILTITVLDCKRCISWGATVTTLTVLLLVFIYFMHRRNEKRNNLKIKKMEKELNNKESDKKELEIELASKKHGKLIRWYHLLK